MSEDLIRRSDAINALRKLGHEVVVIDKVCSLGVAHEFIDAIRDIPSADRPPKVIAQITFDEEKLREIVKEAVERFKEEYKITDRPQGEWIRINDDWIDGTCGARYFPIRCSACGYSTYDDDTTNYCPNCGARMKGADDE